MILLGICILNAAYAFLILGHVSAMRWGWFFLEGTRILSGIQFPRHFIEFVVVETKQFVGDNVNVILTRQICGQRSSMSAACKRRALSFYFCVRICHMFLISKCRGESDLGLCTGSVLAKRIPLRSGDFRQFCGQIRFFNRKSPPCSGIVFPNIEVVHRPRSDSSYHFGTRNI